MRLASLRRLRGARQIWAPVVVLVTTLAVGVYVVHLSHIVDQTDRQRTTELLLSSLVAELERDLNHALSSTFILAQEVQQNKGDFEYFSRYARSLLGVFPQISYLELAPKGVVSRRYPLWGYEFEIGRNLLKHSDHREEALAAIKTQQLTLVGPTRLPSGGIGFIGRYPVFTEHLHQSEFWGFSSASILLDELIQGTQLGSLEKRGVNYQLGKINSETNAVEIFSKTNNPLGVQQQQMVVQVPNGSWMLTVDHLGQIEPTPTASRYFIVLLIAGLLTALSRSMLGNPEDYDKDFQNIEAAATDSLEHLVYHDHLTKLPNRLYFTELLESSVEYAVAENGRVTLLLLDLDQFKEVNDTLGHTTGDQLLVESVRRIETCLPAGASFARLGGDEFTIILDDHCDVANAEQLAQTLVNLLATPFFLESHQIHVSASVGIAMLGDEAQTATELLKCADLAMYDAKNKGRSGYSHYTPSLHKASLRRLRLTNDLKDAIANNELHLVYQPIVLSSTGEIVKAEALIRWSHPEFGLINPLEFIPLAESSGLILSIGEWVFRTAALQVHDWRRRFYPGFQISVNASPVQFRSEAHTERWVEILEELQLDGSSILIEITEGILLDDNVRMRAQISKLKEIGVQFALDDFGTGYSSLFYLKSLPIDYLKIDQSFVRNLSSDSDDMFLCEVILMMANKFGLQVVAEGVETLEQFELLAQERCHFAQGYYFSKPERAEIIESRFLENPDAIVSQLNNRAA